MTSIYRAGGSSGCPATLATFKTLTAAPRFSTTLTVLFFIFVVVAAEGNLVIFGFSVAQLFNRKSGVLILLCQDLQNLVELSVNPCLCAERELHGFAFHTNVGKNCSAGKH